MANISSNEELFSAVEPEQEELFPSDEAVSINPYSEKYTEDRALYASLATEPMTGDEAFEAIFNRNKELIERGNERNIKQRAQLSRLSRINEANTSIKQDLLYTPDSVPLLELVDESNRLRQEEEDNAVIEKEAMRKLQDLMVEDPYQASLYVNRLNQGDLIDRQLDHATKLAIFQREVDKLQEELKGQGITATALDFVASIIDAPIASIGKVLNIEDSPVEGVSRGFFELPSNKVNKASAKLFDPSVSVDEFDAAIGQVVAKVKENSGVLKDNNLLAIGELEALRGLNNSDALSYDAFVGLDIVTLPGVGATAKAVAKPARFAKVVGNRAAAVRAAVGDISRTSTNAAVNAQALREAIPSSLVPDLPGFVDPAIGLSGDVSERLDVLARVRAEAVAIPQVERLEPGQIAEAVAKKVEERISDFAGHNIVDVKQLQPREAVAELDGRKFFAEDIFGRSVKDIASTFGVDERIAKTLKETSDLFREPVMELDGRKFFAEDYFNKSVSTIMKETGLDERTANTLKQASDNFKPEPKAPVEVSKEELAGRAEVLTEADTGIRFFNLYLGRKNGEGGFLTENAAKGAMKRMGFGEDGAEIYHGVDDRFYLKVRTNVPETGITTPVLSIDQLGNTGRIGAWIKNPDNAIARVFAEKQHITEGIQARLHAAVVKPLLKPIRKLNNKQQKDLQTILAFGEQEQKRFTQEELARYYEDTFGRLPTEREVEAYYNVQELQDFAWSVLDRNVYVDRARRGFETVRVTDGGEFDTLARNGRIASPERTRTHRVYDLEDQRGYAAGTNEAKFQEKMKTGNYQLVELEGDYVFANEPVKYILANKNAVQRAPLKRTQLGYIPGGQRIYTEKFFVKQANSFEFKDGSKAWRNPLTHFAAGTEREAKEIADNWEAAREAYNQVTAGNITPADADIIISEATSLDYTKFDELVKKGKINPKHKFEALYDRTQPSEMTGVGEQNLWVDEFDSGTTEYLNTRGRLYYSKKSDEGLANIDLERAEVLAPFKALEKSINFAINSRSVSDYSTFAVEEWARLASPYVKRGQFGENPDKFRLFFDAQLDENFVRNNPKAAATLEANRDTIKRFLGFRTASMSRMEMATRALANWIEEESRFAADPRKLLDRNTRRFLARKAMNMMDKNPVNAVNGAVFHSQFGFYDPGQLFLQSQTATAAMTIHPVWGARSAAMYPMIRLVTGNLNEGVLDYVAKRGAKIHDLDPEEFKTMVRTMIRSGEYDIGGSALQYGRFHQAVGGSGVIQSASSVLGKGRVFFDEAERINRTVAWQLAWRETRQKLPELAMDSEEFIRIVKLRAADFGQNMRNASAAQWQKGLFAPATRFWSYQARLLENILPKQFGGNPRFSAGQKARLAIGQFLLYGTAGVPAFDYFADKWKENRGEDLTPDQWRLLTKGFYDNFLYTVSSGDIDTAFADRAGVGAGWTQTIERLFDGSQNSFIEVLGGAQLSIGGNVFESFNRIVEYGKAGLAGDEVTSETFQLIAGELASNINSLERYNKAATIWRYGKVRDKVTGQPVVDATQLEGFAALLGIPLSEEKDIYDQYKAVANRQEEIDNNAAMLVKFNNMYFDAMAIGDEKKMRAALQLKKAFMSQFSDDPMMAQQIAKRAVSIDSRVTDKASFAREQYEKVIGNKYPTDETRGQ